MKVKMISRDSRWIGEKPGRMGRLFWKLILPLGLLVGVGFIYSQTAARTITGTADSDELIGVSYAGGALHPPGYPLLRAILYVSTHGLWWWPLAFRGQVVAVILQTMAGAVMLVVTVKFLELYYPRENRGLIKVISLGAVLLLMFSKSYWFWANVIEVTALTSLLVALMWYGLLRLEAGRNNGKKINYWWWGWWGLAGLSLAHHQLIILTFPAMLVGVWGYGKKISVGGWLKTLKIFGLGFSLPYGALGIFKGQSADWYWRIKPGLIGLVDYILRRDFAGMMIESGQTQTAYFSKMTPEAVYWGVRDYITVGLTENFHWLLLLLAVAGVIKLVTGKQKQWAYILLGYVGIAGLGLAAYIGYPTESKSIEELARAVMNDRFWVMGFLGLPIIGGIGAMEIGRLLGRVMSRGMATGVMGTLMVTASLQSMFYFWPMVDMSEYKVVDEWAETLLRETQEQAMVFCHTDVSCFSLLFKQTGEGKYSDRVIWPVTPQIKTKTGKIKADYPDNPWRMMAVVGENVFADNNQVVLAEIEPFYFDLMGMDAKMLITLPYHGGFKLGCDPRLENFDASLNLEYPAGDKLNLSQKHFMRLRSEYHATSAIILGRLKAKEFALAEIAKGLEIDPENEVLESLMKEREEFQGDERYLGFDGCPDGEELDAVAKADEGDAEMKSRLWQWLSGLGDVDKRRAWADYLYQTGYLSLAKREYKMILKEWPEDEGAKGKLIELEAVADLDEEF